MFDHKVLEKIRGDFPGLTKELDGSPVIYLDSAATSLKPQCMIDAVNEYYSGISSNVHRGKNFSLELVSNKYEHARYRVSEFLSCSGNEVVFVRNTTEGINLVASGLELKDKELVIVCSDSHHSNFLPWVARSNTQVVKTTEDGKLDLQHFYALLEKKPRVVAINHCSNVTGVYSPIAEMATAAKSAGAIVLVDCAQSVPHRKINVKELDVDFVVFSGHKMLGPTGMGILYGKRELLESLTPLNYGGGMVDWVDLEEFRLRKIPHRFEAGTPHIAGAYGLGASIEYLNSIGFDFVEQHDRDLGKMMLEEATKRDYMEVVNPDSDLDRGAVLSIRIPNSPKLDDAARVLSDTYGIMCRNGHLCAQPYVDKHAKGQVLRISGYVYTSKEDISAFFAAMDEINPFLFK